MMSVSYIPEKTKIRLWGKTAGRCQYEGCNKPLWLDALTKTEFNTAYIAHIVADSPNGPRGDEVLSEQLKDQISNLMLMCDEHHRLIDREDVEGHPVKVKKWEPKDYVENLYQEFRANGIYKEKVSRNTRCVVIDYKGEFHIDVVPTIVEDGFLSDDETFITNRLENKFEQTNPKGYLDWFQKKNAQTGGMLVKVIRLAKYLRDIKKNFSAKSILLTTLLADQVKTGLWDPDATDESYPDVPTALKTIFNRLNDFLQETETMPHIRNPSMPEEDFVRHWDEQKYQNFRKWISFYTAKINAAYDANRDESIILWREVFGDDFAKGIEVTPPQKSPYDVAHRQTPSWDMVLRNTVTVSATIYREKNVGRLASLGHKDSKKINKSVWIKFEASTGSNSFDSIQWQVVNTGYEASRCLRGDFYPSNDGRNTRWEPTAFKGMHWVEAFVIKDEICIARSGEFEINIE